MNGHTIAGGKMAQSRVSRHCPGWAPCDSKRTLMEISIAQSIGIVPTPGGLGCRRAPARCRTAWFTDTAIMAWKVAAPTTRGGQPRS